MKPPKPPENPSPDDDSDEKPGDGEMPPTHREAAKDTGVDAVIPASQPEEDILDVLSEFETGLESLKALYSQRQRLQTRIREHEEQVKQRETTIAQRSAEVEQTTKEQQKRAAELELAKARLEQRELEIAAATKVMEEQAKVKALDSDLAGKLDEKLKEAAAARDKAVADAEKLAARVADLETKWTQEKAQSGRLLAQLAQQESDTEGGGKALAETQARLKEETTAREQLRKQLEAAADALTKANARAETLQTKLTAVQAEVAAFKEQASRQAAAPKALVPSTAASALRRRQRLKIYRDLVREQAVKVRKASDAIKKKMEACEQVLTNRAELAAIRDRVLEGERRLQRHRAGSRSAVVMLCTVAAFGILATLSWTIAREVAPATYMATSAIKADGRNRELNEAELSEWTRFHQGMLTDPRFHETAADRFKRAGFPTLGAPAAVAEMIRNDLTTEEAGPGEMELHLKGLGSDRTQRALETLTAAITSQANALQGQRIDGGATVVSLAAASGNEPLDNTQMLYFVGILLVGMTVCIGFLVALWKRLAGAKTAFEQDDIVNQALDNNKWAAFTAATAAQQGTAAVAVAAATKGKKKRKE